MNKSTSRWIGETFQCRSCSSRARDIHNDMRCKPCRRLVVAFPNGEVNLRRRGHRFLPRELVGVLPPLYSTDVEAIPNKRLLAHYFVGGSDWYVAEFDPNSGDAFGHADLGWPGWGYFNLREMEAVVVDGLWVVERDVHFKPQMARELGIA